MSLSNTLQSSFNQFCQDEFSAGTRIYLHQLRNCWKNLSDEEFDQAVENAEIQGAIVTMRLEGNALSKAKRKHGDRLYFAGNRGIFYLATH